MVNTKQQRVTDIIDMKTIEKWDVNNIITITAGTGKGKSYFIKTMLYEFAKAENTKILMLIHRSKCVNQFKQEIERDGKTDIIEIKTYQSLEHKEKNMLQNSLREYKYIVCDEFHYFLSDASFNKTTDISMNLVLNQTHAVKIFMSATGDSMSKYLKGRRNVKTTDYNLPINFGFVSTLTFFNKDETFENVFIKDAITKNEKVIIFIQSAERAYKLYKKYKKYCLFCCSKTNESNYYKYVETEKIDNMLKNERFEEPILITTSCLDAGINIIDNELRKIVIDISDVGSLIQCIGRKRLQNPNEQIDVFVKTINNNRLGGLKTQIKKKLEMADYLKEHGEDKYIKKFHREYDKSNIVYLDAEGGDLKLKINELMYFKNKMDIGDILIMLKRGEFGYCKHIAEKLGFYNEDTGDYYYNLINENIMSDELIEYLESVEGKNLYKAAQKKLIELCNIRDDRNRLQKSIGIINAYFNENELNYNVRNKRVKNKGKRCTVWVVAKYRGTKNVDKGYI